jgi:hypothetical protein
MHSAPTETETIYENLAIELIRELRGRRSCAEFSRRIGYRSNMVQRWEAGDCWPTAARFLEIHRRTRRARQPWLERFFSPLPEWGRHVDPTAPATVAAFLRHLKGKTPIVRIAQLTSRNRFSVARWFEGTAEPKLPEFLQLADACSRRLLDLVAAFVDPARLYSVREPWRQLQLAREAAYTRPWSHAVLRALELVGIPKGMQRQRTWIARRLGITEEAVDQALVLLQTTGQVERTARGYRATKVTAVDTGADPERARKLKLVWTGTALERLEAGAEANFGYSVFAISKADFARLAALHSQYVRAMLDLIAGSTHNECVGLYCAQLLDLGGTTTGPPRTKLGEAK